MKTAIKCFMLFVLAFFTSSWLLPASAHPTATGKSCHAVYVHPTTVLDAYQVAVVGGDVIHPPNYAVKSNDIDNGKCKGFDSAMLPASYAELRIYSWYVPQTIGIPLTKSAGSIMWQRKLVLKTDHDKL